MPQAPVALKDAEMPSELGPNTTRLKRQIPSSTLRSSISSGDRSCFGDAGIDSGVAEKLPARVSSAVFGAQAPGAYRGSEYCRTHWEDRASHCCPEAKIPCTAAQQETRRRTLTPAHLLRSNLNHPKGTHLADQVQIPREYPPLQRKTPEKPKRRSPTEQGWRPLTAPPAKYIPTRSSPWREQNQHIPHDRVHVRVHVRVRVLRRHSTGPIDQARIFCTASRLNLRTQLTDGLGLS